jgi:hypothetical protein
VPKTHYPFSLHKFTSSTGDVANIKKDFRDLLDFIVIKEQEIIDTAFTRAVDKTAQDTELIKGSVNRAGVKLGLTPTFSDQEKSSQKHLYNFSEMVRANLTSLVGSYVQRQHLFNIITELPDVEPIVIAKAYKEITGKNVTRVQIEKLLNALRNTGSVDSLPSPPRKLPLWATDTHHCSLSQKGRNLSLTIKTNSGLQVLVFTCPDYVPISNVKFTRPTVMIGPKNRLVFNFTAEQIVETPAEPQGWLGVDLGIIKTYTATGVTPNSTSQSWSDTKQIREITARIGMLKSHLYKSKRKASLNKDRYPERYAVQSNECARLSGKITRLKNYRAHLVANKLIQIAKTNNLGISLENLNWVPGSRWEQSLTQTKIRDEATRHSIKIKKISAKHTSTTCSRCGGTDTTFSGRTLVCKSCDQRVDRDDNASRNIALRALRLKTCPPHFIRWQLRGTTETVNPQVVPFVDITTISTNPQLTTIVRI